MQPKSLLAGMAILFCLSGPAHALSLYGFDTVGGIRPDANSTGINDENLCWAFSAANVLAYTGWGLIPNGNSGDATITFDDTNDIFSYFKDHWENAGSSIFYAINWWFDGSKPSIGAKVTSDGGGFYNEKQISSSPYDFLNGSDESALANTEYCLQNGYTVSLSLIGSTNHAVTVWDYEYDDSGNYLGIYITDSADSFDGLKYYGVEDKGYTDKNGKRHSQWYLENYRDNSYYISEVYGLKNRDNSHYTPGPYPTPEPATLLLFASGLAGIVAIGRRKKIKPS